MMGYRICLVLAVTFCLSVNAVYAQESDPLCDKWFSQERFECPKDYTATIQVPCIPPLQFEPDCVKQEVDAIQEYLLSLYETVDRYSGMFNDMVKEIIILAALGDYQKAVIQASSDIIKGTATKSDYYLTPFGAPSVATAVKLSTGSNGRRDSLYYPPTFQDIISEAKIIEERPLPASGT